jgi:DNA-binding LytR/AlgR family response regulator
MKKLRCLVIEDEPLSQEILAKYIAGIPELELAGVCGDALSASGLIRNSPVDLILLDINLPVISGMHFLKSLSHPPLVIFTTAYPEFAVEGFEADAVDYLVKPFSFERFLKAVNKAFDRISYMKSIAGLPALTEQEITGFLILRADKKVHKVNYAEILYFEATGDYVKVFVPDKCLIVHETVKNILEQLPSDLFIRVHKSFIVPVGRISFIEGNRVNIGGVMIPIGLVYRKEVMKVFKKP